MASFLCGHEVFQISASASYGVTEFKADLLTLYAKTGSKGVKVTFLLTDSNIIQERFLVYINDLLSTGHVADLCTPVSFPQAYLPQSLNYHSRSFIMKAKFLFNFCLRPIAIQSL